MQAGDNPFTRLYSAFRLLFENDQTFNNLIPKKNQVFMDGNNRDPVKEAITSADLPEAIFTASGGPIDLYNSSSSARIEMNYQLIISTGDYRINHYVNVMQWMLICNAMQWQTAFENVTWRGENFVKKVSVSEARITESVPERNRNIKGYAAIWGFSAACYFSKTNLVFSEQL